MKILSKISGKCIAIQLQVDPFYSLSLTINLWSHSASSSIVRGEARKVNNKGARRWRILTVNLTEYQNEIRTLTLQLQLKEDAAGSGDWKTASVPSTEPAANLWPQ